MESSIAEFLLRLYACELQPTRMNFAIQSATLLPRGAGPQACRHAPEASFPMQGGCNIIMAVLLVLTVTCKLRKSL